MFVKIKRVEPTGIIVTILDKVRAGEEAWLPQEEWSRSLEDWKDERDALEIDQQLFVVELQDKQEPVGRPVVSRKRFKLENVDNSWMYATQTMKVETISRTLIRGRIDSMQAVIRLQKYIDFFERRRDRIGTRLMDHSALAKGDPLRGFVVGIPPRELELDPEQYLDALDEELSNGQRDLHETERQYDVKDRPPSLSREVAARISPVLLVENDQVLLHTIQSILREAGTEVQTAESLEESRKLIEDMTQQATGARAFGLAIIDPNLDPGNTDLLGMHILQDLAVTPECRIILITGEENERKIDDFGHMKIHGFIDKPFTMEFLLQTIDQALEIESKSVLEWLTIGESESLDQSQEDTTSRADELVKNPTIAMQKALEDLESVKPGIVAHVFELHPRSFRAKSLVSIGSGMRWYLFRGKIGKSRIKDSATSSTAIIENVSAHNERFHLWTLQMMQYKSFYGIPIKIMESANRYTMVAFHRDPDVFDNEFKSAAMLCAEKIARALERDRLLQIRQNEASFIATGMGLESLGHELYTDLTTSEGQTDILHSFLSRIDSLSPENREEADDMIRAIRHEIKGAIAKTKALRGVSSPRNLVSIGGCLRRAAISCRNIRGRFIRRAEDISIDLPEENLGPDYQINVAPAVLIIVFFNLYLNAVQQIDLMRGIRRRGHVRHSLERREDDEGNSWVFVRIHDTGPGIHPDDWERIFEPGYTTKPEGMGFGLYITRHLVNPIRESDRHATVRVTRSVLWDGTTFTVKLPITS